MPICESMAQKALEPVSATAQKKANIMGYWWPRMAHATPCIRIGWLISVNDSSNGSRPHINSNVVQDDSKNNPHQNAFNENVEKLATFTDGVANNVYTTAAASEATMAVLWHGVLGARSFVLFCHSEQGNLDGGFQRPRGMPR